MAAVRLVDVEKRWGDVVGVARQSLEVEDGEFMVFLGPSGCGKTTTMRMVAGLELPSAGDIWIGERNVTQALPKDRDVAMVFQNYGLYPHMTVRENIAYPLKVRGLASAQRLAQVEEVAHKVELEQLLDRHPRELSGGQRQRVAVARAIVRRPQVFLMDEPLSNLDAKLRGSMRAEIWRLQKELGITTIYVTHDQIEAMTLAHRVAVMNKGVIQQLGAPEEVYNRPANLFVAGFMGSPPMNLLPARLQDSVLEVAGQRLAGLVNGSCGEAVAGIRPEDITLTSPEAGHLAGQVYMFELTGEAVLVTVDVAGQKLCVRGDRSLRYEIGAAVGLVFGREHLHLFDACSGNRLPGR
ncbi:ABC transporter ATP-binding protein [Candidimonas nitroreducens]|uniref:ABC transporter ATP-binding protein n=1 Tax=Candidimonas nitroreducens TaxID=683354 RepID=A0A225M5Y7_9BURK|nr:sn-glycerol-3-phosphate ABC transporter ATP-binding protein UgpC [Candidimonas nitroreducens]OWT56755.1 ABC transporter ATP-binding protein [Candidimonas nitroreducens]